MLARPARLASAHRASHRFEPQAHPHAEGFLAIKGGDGNRRLRRAFASRPRLDCKTRSAPRWSSRLGEGALVGVSGEGRRGDAEAMVEGDTTGRGIGGGPAGGWSSV